MNEFIVWDNLEEEFIDEEYIARYSGGILFKADIDNEVIDLLLDEKDDKNRYIPFDYIGKTDINGEKIYADSSIVKFEYIPCDKEHIVKAYFTWDDEYLKYIIDPLEGYDSTIEYESFKFLNIEIVDTIQENKLGLLK